MNLKQVLLFPASQLYRGITAARNVLYENNVLKSQKFELPVIVVGNLTVGGTGKTPHIEYLVRLLKNKAKLAVLSRGYKRKSKGFILAGDKDSALTIGDEPMLYHTQFPDIMVAVGEDRPAAIKKLLATDQKPDVILLDDAFQHRALQASFYILLTDFGRLFYKDFVLPAGLLRESRAGAERANAVIITKCPEQLSETEKAEIKSCVRQYSGQETPIFFTSYKYGAPVCFGNANKLQQQIILLTGIANPKPLQEHLIGAGYNIVAEMAFADHYSYSAEDVEKVEKKLSEFAPGSVSVITTSKDAIKLRAPNLGALTTKLPLFYIPVEVSFADGNKAGFDEMIQKAAGIL